MTLKVHVASLIFPHCVVVCTDNKQQSHNLRVLTGTIKTYSSSCCWRSW